ncbi:DUF4163 domain-containing protein [Paenibacillus kribbensis]|uniref:DUF4163 domain-containing protein n=1 Tax=Paenibacillus kribbensis TaxID=172713 RepID=UPI002DBDE5DD|nr:DUF4163 domain-containing protein [Paenibacillus kribbensis]MEC0235357.1 DUF4163 domain-containing protein [Paenibacillus kribbensis]
MNGCTKENDSSITKTNHALSLQNDAKTISYSKKLDALVQKIRIVNDENMDSDVRQKKIEEFTIKLNLLLNEPESVEMKDGALVEKFDNNLTILTKSFWLKSGQLNVRVVNYRAPTTVTGTIGGKYTFIQWWSTKELVHAQMLENDGPELTTDFIVRDSEHGIQLLLGGHVSIYHPDPVFVDLWELSRQKWMQKSIDVGKMKLPDAWELNKDVDELILENRQHDSMSIEVLDHGDGFLISKDNSDKDIIIEFFKSGEVRIDSAHSLTSDTHTGQQSYELIQEKYSENGIVIKYPQITKLEDAAKQKSLNQILKTEALKGLHEYGDSDSGAHLEIDYEIKRQSERLLSIEYTGIRYVKKAAYPNHIFYTTNLDMKQASKLRLSDLIKIEKPFIKLLKNGKFTAVEPEQKDLIANFTQRDLIQWLTSADVPEGSAEESESDTFSYLTSDSLGISIPVVHAAGDHAEYEIRLQQIPDDMKRNKELWQELGPAIAQSATVVNEGKLDSEKFSIDEDQSFETSFEGWGSARFVSTVAMIEDAPGNYFFLLDEQNYILYSFPEFYGNNWLGTDWISSCIF